MKKQIIFGLFAVVLTLGVNIRAQSNYSTPYALSTLAGSVGSAGFVNGSNSVATFNFPSGLAIGSDNSVYIADQFNGTIRKISPAGVVSTYVTGAASKLSHPTGLTIDSKGVLYIADPLSQGIYSVSTTGTVTLLAGGTGVGGTGSGGGVDGVGTAATFYGPRAIAVDSSGNLFVADTGNYDIRKITPAGVVTTFAGSGGAQGTADGVGAAARFFMPAGITIDSSGNLYVSDTNNCTIRKITPAGVVTTIAGNPGIAGSVDGTGNQAQFNYPTGITVDATGNLYVCDQFNSVIRKVTPAGVVTTLSGLVTTEGSVDGVGSAARLAWPYCIAVDSNGKLYISDFENYTIRTAVISSQGVIPKITQQPVAQVATAGGAVKISVSATGSSLTYQWYLNGLPILGATSSSYTINSFSNANVGVYTVTVTGTGGSVTSSAASVVATSTNPGHLMNLSVLSMDGPGSQLLTIGFVSNGAAGSTQPLLVRAIGPALSAFGVPTVMADPQLTVYDANQVVIGSNDNWGNTSANIATITAADSATGAFALSSTSSLDAALLLNVPTGAYTAQAAGKSNATGNVLAEIYDATSSSSYTSTSPRLVNISCLEQVASGAVLTAGFVVGGSTPEKVLIRASGPTLAGSPFNVPNTIPDPQFTVYDSNSSVVGFNSVWGGSPSVTAANAATGAFQFSSYGSKDSATVLTLNPGAYTVQVKSATGQSGVTLIEVYEIP